MKNNNENNKIFRLLFINLSVVFLLMLILEFIAWGFSVFSINNYENKYNCEYKNKYHFNYLMQNYDDFYNKNESSIIRSPSGLKYNNKKSIVLFGCSFAYGFRLDDKNTFSYKLSEYTKRTVYNRGICGGGLQHVFVQFENSKELKKIKEPEYVFYLYNECLQTHRLYAYIFEIWDNVLYPRYQYKNGELTKIKSLPKIINGLYLIKYFYKLAEIKHVKNIDENIKFTVKHFIKMKNYTDSRWKNSEFIVLIYPYFPSSYSKMITDRTKIMLENNGIKVINIADIVDVDLNDTEYQISEVDNHPNEKVWNIVVPELCRKLNL